MAFFDADKGSAVPDKQQYMAGKVGRCGFRPESNSEPHGIIRGSCDLRAIPGTAISVTSPSAALIVATVGASV